MWTKEPNRHFRGQLVSNINCINLFIPKGWVCLSFWTSSFVLRVVWLYFILCFVFRSSFIQCKQCRPWSDATSCGIKSRSALFVQVSLWGCKKAVVYGDMNMPEMSYSWASVSHGNLGQASEVWYHTHAISIDNFQFKKFYFLLIYVPYIDMNMFHTENLGAFWNCLIWAVLMRTHNLWF